MKPMDPSGHVAAVLCLRLEGFSVRRIASHLHLARKTVRTILGRHRPPAKATAQRGLFLDTLLDDTPEMLAQVEST